MRPLPTRKSTLSWRKSLARVRFGGANDGVEALGECGQELLPQHPLKAREDVKAAEDSQVASNTWLARPLILPNEFAPL